jgi:BirA family biotin operon repressor/biotin-[acetyl-CoA-carboxylase] ligase
MTTRLPSAKELAATLPTQRFGKRLYSFDSIDSTNSCAKVLAGVGAEEGTVVLAEYQTAGRGRLGRRWEAEPRQNLIFSLVLRPSTPADHINLLPLYVAVALAQAVEETTGLRPECKWPNDLLCDKRKFAGILMEGSVTGGLIDHVIVGIGMNVNQTSFPPELQDRATSLSLACGHEIDRFALLNAILLRLEKLYTELSRKGFSSVLTMWEEYASLRRRYITVSHNGLTTRGLVSGLSKEGGLIIQANGEEHTFFAGDVTILET